MRFPQAIGSIAETISNENTRLLKPRNFARKFEILSIFAPINMLSINAKFLKLTFNFNSETVTAMS